jgi:glycosyltransferase involved in cell wall biosynthesis
MRVLVATDQWSPDVIGGSARVATATAEGFAKGGDDVTVLAPRIAGLAATERVGGVELHRSIRRGPLPQTIGDTLGTWQSARRMREPSVLAAHQATGAVGLTSAHPGVPLLCVFHASAPLEQRFLRPQLSRARRGGSVLLDPMLVQLERTAIRRAAVIAVLSEYSRDLLLSRHPSASDRIALVSGGVDVERFSAGDATRTREAYGIPADARFVLTVRRLEPRMGVEELLRAVSVLVRDGVRLNLAIAGGGMLESQLRTLAGTLGLDGHVRFLGRVPDDDLPGLYAAADLFVLPTVAYEGFGMATVEALAAGTPVVGTAIGATPEILGPLGQDFVSPTAEPSQLAATMRQALKSISPELRARCAEYASAAFGWERAIGPWNDALLRAARSRAPKADLRSSH